MTIAPLAKPSDEAKLDILRRLDQFRRWQSLDEKRYCLTCGEMITGREINVIATAATTGRLRIVCPTEHCDATPIEWVWPTDGVLITIAMMDAERQWLRLITRAGSAMRSRGKKIASDEIIGKRPRLPSD